MTTTTIATYTQQDIYDAMYTRRVDACLQPGSGEDGESAAATTIADAQAQCLPAQSPEVRQAKYERGVAVLATYRLKRLGDSSVSSSHQYPFPVVVTDAGYVAGSMQYYYWTLVPVAEGSTPAEMSQ